MTQQELDEVLQHGTDDCPVNLCGADLSGLSLDRANLRNAYLVNTNFTGCRMDGADLTMATADGSVFDEAGLQRASFVDARITEARFRGADMRKASFIRCFGCEVDMSHAAAVHAKFTHARLPYVQFNYSRLVGANFLDAVLWGACFEKADCQASDMRRASMDLAVLDGSVFRDADMKEASLEGASLSDADMAGAVNYVPPPVPCPETGAFEAYKKVSGGFVAKLVIPEDARRTGGSRRCCRADKARVVALLHPDGTVSGCTEAASCYNPDFKYRVGDEVRASGFDADRWKDVAEGIHFFTSFSAAAEWVY